MEKCLPVGVWGIGLCFRFEGKHHAPGYGSAALRNILRPSTFLVLSIQRHTVVDMLLYIKTANQGVGGKIAERKKNPPGRADEDEQKAKWFQKFWRQRDGER